MDDEITYFPTTTIDRPQEIFHVFLYAGAAVYARSAAEADAYAAEHGLDVAGLVHGIDDMRAVAARLRKRA